MNTFRTIYNVLYHVYDYSYTGLDDLFHSFYFALRTRRNNNNDELFDFGLIIIYCVPTNI
jgi:hypothetical protein